ncbi:helix-turn-helix domain-containing protein [Pseudacidovorax sp. RU35E]|uniref:helix-turn-helix domain-containing protein n=1 Tax=Pseudacidovorax sp. RU35E TaxID=1907403 RepID=UPI000953DCDC|nr:helix-turn-helix transcriptional regulator [Pseudacidovorax sp. RU35E]SIQ73186.1 Helix-turn-helix [Pseudacidovorax sp. RU35E]
MELTLSPPAEIASTLCARLRTERLAQGMTQAEVAARAGMAVNTVSNLEAGRSTAFENVVRVAIVLGRREELAALFQPRLESLHDIARYEGSARRQRVRRKAGDA